MFFIVLFPPGGDTCRHREVFGFRIYRGRVLRESPIGGFNIYETGGEVVIEGVVLQHGPPFGGGGVGGVGVEICADDGCGCAKYDT